MVSVSEKRAVLEEKRNMFYQKIFGAEAPFRVTISQLQAFPEHRHGDLEIHFAMNGGFNIMNEAHRALGYSVYLLFYHYIIWEVLGREMSRPKLF